MSQMEDAKRKVVHTIASAPSLAESLQIYGTLSSIIPEYKFVFGAKSGATPGFAFNRELAGGAVVRGLFKEDHVVVLDPETFKEMKSGSATYQIDYSISLDTNAFSHLARYIASDGRRAPAEFVDVFEFLARDDVRVDGMPYILENFDGLNLQDAAKTEPAFDSIKAYEVLRTIDGAWLRDTGQVRSTLDDAALIKRAQETIGQLCFNADSIDPENGVSARVNYLYANLLKIALIQFQGKGWTADRKVEEYVNFCHSRLATINVREMAIARTFFEVGQKLKFFGKIQSGRDDLLALLKNMAWDLFHIRQLEAGVSMRPDPKARYYFPALLTYDKGLIEVMDLYPLQSIAFTNDQAETMPIYAGNPDAFISTNQNQLQAVGLKYFSETAMQDRGRRRSGVWVALPGIISELEEKMGEFRA